MPDVGEWAIAFIAASTGCQSFQNNSTQMEYAMHVQHRCMLMNCLLNQFIDSNTNSYFISMLKIY